VRSASLLVNKGRLMRMVVPAWALLVIGVCVLGCTTTKAQETPAPLNPQLQVEESSPFAAEIRQLEIAVDQAARRAAFALIIQKAADLKRDPDPLLSILRNKKPEDTYRDLVEYVRDVESGRHASFVPALVLAANDPGDGSRAASDAVLAYRGAAVPPIIHMLDSETPGERLAAAAIAGRRIGGIAGAARLIPALIAALDHPDVEFTTVVQRSLSRQTLLEQRTPRQWKEWLDSKSELELIIEIADREREARQRAEQQRDAAEAARQADIIARMRSEAGENPVALAGWLRDGEFVVVRMEAIRLLRAQLRATLDDAVAAVAIEALGAVLNNPAEPEELRRESAALLADSGKPALAFPQIDRALQGNEVSSDLRLALVRGLNSPIAAPRLAEQLRARVDIVESRSGPLLDELIKQIHRVLETDDETEAGKAIILELARLLTIVSVKVSEPIEAPARARFVDIALRTSDALVQLARLRGVDITPCIPPLVTLSCGDTPAAAGALAAIRESLGIRKTRAEALSFLSAPPAAESLAMLYQRLIAGNEEAMLVNLFALYEEIAVAPEPVEKLKLRLLQRANDSEAVLPDRPGVRRTVRDGLRGLLAKLIDNVDEHAGLVNDLLNCVYGDRDALGYLQVLRGNRVHVIVTALQPRIDAQPVRIARIVLPLEATLTADELADDAYQTFRKAMKDAARADIANRVSRDLAEGMNEERRAEHARLASGHLRTLWVPAAKEQLRLNADAGEARDALALIFTDALKRAHPERYDRLTLAGLSREEFLRALDALNGQLKQDGYPVP
jgi:hypothetical protein